MFLPCFLSKVHSKVHNLDIELSVKEDTKSVFKPRFSGGPCEARTHDLLIKSSRTSIL
jgi:hypothetical protein